MAIAAISEGNTLHIVKWTGRVRLHAEAQTYCARKFDAAEGVLQVPDEVFTKTRAYVSDGQPKFPCGGCCMAYRAAL
jgi:hypothetical protein